MAPSRPRPSASRRRSADDLRKDAIAQTRALMAAEGVEAVQARRVADGLGVSVGTLYNLFGDLEGLIFAAAQTVYDDLDAHLNDALSGAGTDAMTRARGLAAAYRDFVFDQQGLWSSVLSFNSRAKGDVPPDYRAAEQRLLGIAQHIVGGLPGNAPEAQKALTATALWAAIHGILTVSVGPDGLTASQQTIEAQIDLVVGAVLKELIET